MKKSYQDKDDSRQRVGGGQLMQKPLVMESMVLSRN